MSQKTSFTVCTPALVYRGSTDPTSGLRSLVSRPFEIRKDQLPVSVCRNLFFETKKLLRQPEKAHLRKRRPTMPLNSRLKPDMMLFLSRTLSELHQPSSRRKIPGSCFPATGISVCFSLSAGFSGKSGTAFPRPGFQQRPDVVVGNIGAVQTQRRPLPSR